MRRLTVVKTVKFAFYGMLLFAALILCADIAVDQMTRGLTYSEPEKIRHSKAGLLLGTSRSLRGGGRNPFFYHRITAAVQLYRAGKIENIIVSGDNQTRFYNEPEEMKRELVKRGVPRERIYLDYAGLRTLDSVVRCGEIFGQTSFTVISQEFQNRRAVLLGRYSGLDVVGYNAADVGYFEGFKTRAREYFARAVMFTDLFFGKRPHFLGKKVVVK